MREVVIDYTNHRGERRVRRVLPQGLWFGTSSYHPGDQWILSAVDLEDPKRPMKHFAMSGIHSWKNA